jgi:hypothetical protein
VLDKTRHAVATDPSEGTTLAAAAFLRPGAIIMII